MVLRRVLQLGMFERFSRVSAIDLSRMDELCNGMDQMLDALAPAGSPRISRPRRPDWLGKIPMPLVVQRPGNSAMAVLCSSIVNGQVPSTIEDKPWPRDCEWGDSWYVGPLPVDSQRILELCIEYGYNDFVKDFVIAPSANAVSILTIAMVESPAITANISGLETSLKSGCSFVAFGARQE
jgi:hypothetical protein